MHAAIVGAGRAPGAIARAPAPGSGDTGAISHFADVDRSPDPASLIASLDQSAVGLGAMKQYVATRLATLLPIDSVVLDLGCGAGHDLELLAAQGFVSVGVDRSAVMLGESRRRGHRSLVQAAVDRLPFGAGSVDGCRIERTLIHVDDPAAVLAEVARVLRPGGFVTAFEPDWTTLTVCGEPVERPTHSTHQDIGGRLESLAEGAGLEVVDVVTERSRTRDRTQVPIRVPAVADITRPDFVAEWTKTLVVALRCPT